ncbi:hypothetical protein [Nocardia sp. MW-W600-9]
MIDDLEISLEIDRRGLEAHDSRVDAFERAMNGVVRVECCVRSREREPTASMVDLRRSIAALVSSNSRTMAYYLMNSHYRATSVMVEGWRDVSVRRSAIQFLLDNYPGMRESLGEDDVELVAEIDDVLRDHADEAAPLPKSAIPVGIPESHWWWWAPSASASCAEHVRQILE